MISDGLRFSFIRTDGLLLTQFCHGTVSTFSRLKVNPFNCSNCPAVGCIGGQFRHYRKIHNVGHKLYINKPTPNVCRHSGSALVSCAFPTKSSHIISDVESTLSCYADISEHVRYYLSTSSLYHIKQLTIFTASRSPQPFHTCHPTTVMRRVLRGIDVLWHRVQARGEWQSI